MMGLDLGTNTSKSTNVLLAAFTPIELSAINSDYGASSLSRMTLKVAKNGPFSFAYQLTNKQAVRFQVLASPAGQTCIITSDFNKWLITEPGFQKKEVR
jgi:hypothetical protein